MKKSILVILVCIIAFSIHSQTINFTVNTVSSNNSITCSNPGVVFTATSNFSGGAVTYYWANNSTTVTGNSATLTTPGIYTVAAVSIPNFGTQTINVLSNTVSPSVSLNPTVANITCTGSPTTFTLSTSNPTNNITSSFLTPSGGSVTSNGAIAYYTANSPGTYTASSANQINGCITNQTFTVTSNNAYPSYTLSSSNNFSLGCSTKSVISISLSNIQAGIPGAGLTYTLIPPGASTAVTGPFSAISTFSVIIPGSYMMIVYESGSGCMTKTPFSVLQNTVAPGIDTLIIPTKTLNCNTPSITLYANSNTPNIAINWVSSNFNQSGTSFLINTNQSAPSATALGNVTCTILDNGNFCKTQTVFPLYQNIFKPNAIINASGSNIRTCLSSGLVLTNQSTSSIPVNSSFTNTLPVVGQTWIGHPSQPSLSLSPTFTILVAGTYTLTAKDLNNGCTAVATFIVDDCSGLGEISTKEKIQFYPNPCRGQLTILTGINNEQEIIISDLLGQKITEIHLINSHSIDVSQLPKGVYFISVSQNNKVIETSRFIKE